MRRTLSATILGWFLGIMGSATGADAGSLAHCIQRGLTKAGYDTKGVDGLPGNNTFAAAAAYAEAHPEVGLPDLNRKSKRDALILRDWCFHLDPPATYYGTIYRAIEHVDGTRWILTSPGPIVVQIHEYAKVMRSRLSWRGQSVDVGFWVREATAKDRAWPSGLAEEISPLETRSDPVLVETEFFKNLAANADTAFTTSGPKQRDIVFRGGDGLIRGVVFFDDPNEPTWFYRAATPERWRELGEITKFLDWTELSRIGVEHPLD